MSEKQYRKNPVFTVISFETRKAI